MAAHLYPGIKSLKLVLDTPTEVRDGITDIRDDLMSVKVWYSTTPNFTPPAQGTLVPSGNSLSVDITGLTPNTVYYVKYAFISAIDPTVYTVSAALSQTVYEENIRVYGYLTNATTPVVTQADGTGGDFSSTGVFKVFNLSTEVTGNGPVYGIKTGSNTGITTPIINATTGVYSCSGLSGNNGSVIFTATYDNITVEQVWNVYKSKAGQTAPLLQLSATTTEFVYKDQFSTTSLTPQTVITARLVNLTGTPNFTVTGYKRDGTSLGSIPFTQSNNVITITQAQFDSLGVDIGTAQVSATLSSSIDSISIYRINDGTEQITVELSNEAHVIPSDSDGNTVTANYIGSGTTIKVKQGNTYLPVDNSSPFAQGSWRVTSIVSTGITCDTSPGVYTNYIEYDQHSAMTESVATINYTITGTTTTGAAFSIVKVQSFSKAFEGKPGADSISPVTVIVSNENHIFPTASNGSVSAYGNSGTFIRVYEGTTEIVYDGQGLLPGKWKVTAAGDNITPGSIGSNGIFAAVQDHSGVANNIDTAIVNYTISGVTLAGNPFNITKSQTFSKSRAGVDGTAYWLTVSSTVLQKAKTGTISPNSITVNAYSVSGTAAPTAYTGKFKIYENGSSTAAYSSAAAESSKTYTISGNTVTSVKVELYLAGDNFASKLDEQSIPVLLDGIDGNSATAYWLVVSPATLQKTKAGTVTPNSVTITAYSATGTNTPALYSGRFKVYENDSATALYSSLANESSKTYTLSGNTVTSVKAELYLAGGTTTKLDEQAVPVLVDGIDGISAITAILSNETHVFPAANNGAVSSYTGSGTIIRVYEGATELLYDAVGTAASRWTVTASAVNITTGTITDSGDYATVGVHGGVADGTDASSITYTITGKNSAGTSFTITKTQTFSKSKTGPASTTPGPTGASTHRAYIATANSTTAPAWTAGTTTVSGAAPSGWSLTPVTLASGQAQWQVDGTTPANSTVTTWSTPYLSYFKVDTLEAITTNTGNLSVSGKVKTSTAVRSNTTMTGAGVVVDSDGTFAVGNATNNITYNGTAITLNGTVVFPSNIDTKNLTLKDNSGNVLIGNGTNLNYSNITPSNGWLNSQISIASNGVLSGAGGGTVSITGLGYNGDLNANKTYVDGSGNIQGVSSGAGTTVDNTQVKVGGTNFFLNSSRFTNLDYWNSNGGTIALDTVNKYAGYNTISISGNQYGAQHGPVMRLKPDTLYTVSALVKGSSNALTGGYDSNLHIQSWRDEDTGNVHQETGISYDNAITTSWRVIQQTFRTPTSANATYCRFYFYPLATGFTLNIAYTKLEEGNKATDWTPNPEEIKNTNISISSSGTLSGAGGGTVSIGGLGYTGALDANNTYVDGSGNIYGVSANAGTKVANNQISISLSNAGTLTASGGPSGSGTVSIGGLGYTGDLNATYGAQSGANLKDSSGTVIKDDAFRNNLINVDWWKRDASIPWSQNNEFNRIISVNPGGGGDLQESGPRGGNDLVWYCQEVNNNGESGGGWNASISSALDPSKTYRFAIAIRVGNNNGGTAYWGTQNVCDLNTTNYNGNPYFAVYGRNSMSTDRWYLFVGYVFPYGSTGNSSDSAGVWDCKTGLKVSGGTNYCHTASGANTHRAYQYYASQGANQRFSRPMINMVDGTEPSLREYFEPNAVLNNAISISSAGVLSGAGGGTVSISGLGYTGALDANNTYVDGSGNIYGVSANAGTKVANNQISISLSNSGSLTASGGPSGSGTVSIGGLGYTGALDANNTYVDGSGNIYGVSANAGTKVANNQISISLSNSGSLTASGGPSGSGTVSIGGLGYTGALDANKTYVDGSGNIQGVSSGAGTAVSNNLIETLSLSTSGGMTVAGNTFTKTSGGGGWDAQVYSNDSYVGGAYVRFSALQTWASIMVGLNTDPTLDASYYSLDYAIYLAGNAVYIYESGNGYNMNTTYTLNDVFSVTYDGSYIKYYKNGSVLRAVQVNITNPLYLDSSFVNVGSGVSKVSFGPMSSNAWSAITGQPAGIYNSNISISSAGVLSGAGGGTVSITGLGYTGALDANKTYVDANGDIQGVSANAGTKVANNQITISSAGVLSGAGGGTVSATGLGAVKTDLTNAPAGILNSNVTATSIGAVKTDLTNAPAGILNSNISLGTLGAGAFATLDKITGANIATYISGAAIGTAQIGILTAGNIGAGTIDASKIAANTITADKISSNAIWGNTLQVGDNPAINGSTMSGSGAIINSNGTFALGVGGYNTSNTNLSFNGTTLTLNGNVVATGNIFNNAVSAFNSYENTAPVYNTYNQPGEYFVASVTFTPTTTSGYIQILFTCNHTAGFYIYGEETVYQDTVFKLKFNGTTIYSMSTKQNQVFMFRVNAVSSSQAFTFSIYADDANSGSVCYNRLMSVQAFYK
jgi:hypothetical protein